MKTTYIIDLLLYLLIEDRALQKVVTFTQKKVKNFFYILAKSSAKETMADSKGFTKTKTSHLVKDSYDPLKTGTDYK